MREFQPIVFPEAMFVDGGADSKVYRIGDRVFKDYHSHMTIDQLLLYQNVTKRAAYSSSVRDAWGSVLIDGSEFGIGFSVNPILYVCIDGDNLGAVSAFIDGVNLHEYNPMLASSHWNRGWNRHKGSYPRKERRFLERVRDAKVSGYEDFFNGAYEKLSNISDSLCEELDVEGINITDINVRVGLDLRNRMFVFTVTDLCAGLRDFKVHE